jgi:membrane glycosyltransferase
MAADASAATAAPENLALRRAAFATLNAVTMAGTLWLAVVALSPRGLDGIDAILLALFALTLPWQSIGFWNAAIGFLIMRFARDPAAFVLPAAARIRDDEPIVASTAVLMCVRNETPERAARNLRALIAGLVATGFGARFHVYVLSDTDEVGIAAAEEARFRALAAEWMGRLALTYRRRLHNTGFKAGNIEDFCDRFGQGHEFAMTLDADSVMPAEAVLRLVRIMQAAPEIGILQGLVIGTPAKAAFARLFQFGMRLGMRSYTLGSAWWQGDCGPYWGHNGIIRLASFMAHCRLPKTEAPILSHDQIEAVLMRRAGHEVRVLAREDLGFEDNPPTLIEFLRRDLRWCQGNMQYFGFLALPGLEFVSRYQLAFAILMFLGSPAWIGLYVIGVGGMASARTLADFMRPGAGVALLVAILVMWFAPKLATAVDTVLRADRRRAFGGGTRFAAGVAAEILFTFLLLPVMWLRHTLFMAALLRGRAVGWAAQRRDGHAVPWSEAARNLWPHAVVGLSSLAVVAATHPAALPYALLIGGGLALAIPFAVITSSPLAGEALMTLGLGRLPEETEPPAVLREVATAIGTDTSRSVDPGPGEVSSPESVLRGAGGIDSGLAACGRAPER